MELMDVTYCAHFTGLMTPPPTATTVTAEQEMQPLGDVIEGDPTSDV